METKYDGYTIKYNEVEAKFTCKVDGEGEFEAPTLRLLKLKLDKIGSVDGKKQKNQNALHIDDGYRKIGLMKAIIGKFGIVNHRSYKETYFWVTKIIPPMNGYKERTEKERVIVDSWSRSYYVDNLANRTKLEKVVAIRKEIEDFKDKKHKEEEKIIKSLKNQIIQPTLKEEDLPIWDK